jgi:hypothetical protein
MQGRALNNMREIKLRALRGHEKKMWNLREVSGYYFGDIGAQTHADPMQDTGLKDKNGKEIYEADILEFNDKGHYRSVIWLEEMGCWGTLNENALGRASAVSDKVGNIYENCELLGEGSERRA